MSLERSSLHETETGARDWRLRSREGWRWKPGAPGCLCPGDSQQSVLSHVTPLRLPSRNHMDKSKWFLLSAITPLALSTYRARILLAEKMEKVREDRGGAALRTLQPAGGPSEGGGMGRGCGPLTPSNSLGGSGGMLH